MRGKALVEIIKQTVLLNEQSCHLSLSLSYENLPVRLEAFEAVTFST